MPAASREARVLVFHSYGVGQLISVPTLPAEGETIWSDSWEVGTDGAKGSNTAVALGSLEIPTAFIGRTGTDLWSGIGLQWLDHASVDYSHMIRDPRMHTQIGIVIVDKEGKNSIILGGDAAEFTTEEIRAGIMAYPHASFLITGFEMDIPSALSIMKQGKEAGKYVILNPSPAPTEPIGPLHDADLVILNQHECRRMLELADCLPSGNLSEDLRHLKRIYSCQDIVMTLGSEGAVILQNDEITRIPAVKVTAVDTSGAGDAFLAAVCAALCEGASLTDACRLAAYYAALTVQKSGTYPAFSTRKELLQAFPEAANLIQKL